MNCGLPEAPEKQSEWPWQVAEEPGGSALTGSLPGITVITPSFNQAPFIEMTIRSVLLQGYPDVEYMVIDGGSSDGSVPIIEKYGQWLAHWESGRDRGQSHAINKGLARATREVVCWLNSDDYLLPGTLMTVGRTLSRETGNLAMVGHVLKVGTDGRDPVLLKGGYAGRERLLQFWRGYEMHQAAIFWRREVGERAGLLDERLHLTMDFDYWTRLSRHCDFVNVDQVLAVCHYHEGAKTGDDYAAYHAELRRRAWRYWGSPLSAGFWRLALSFARETRFHR